MANQLKIQLNPKGFDFEAAPDQGITNPTDQLVASVSSLKPSDVLVVERASTGTALRIKTALKRTLKQYADRRYEVKRPDRDHWAVKRAA